MALALQLSVTGQRIGAERAAARAAGQPEATALAAFDRARDIHPAGEVHLIARIDPAAVITVEERTRTSSGSYQTDTRRLYLLSDPSDAPDSRIVRAAILMPDAWVGRFLAHVAEARIADGDAGQVFALNGVREVAPALARPALAAIRGLGLEPAPGFVFVMPFLEGRDAALADRESSWRWLVGIVSSLGAATLVAAIATRMRQAREAAEGRRSLEAERIRR